MTNFESIREKDAQYLMQTYGRFPVAIVKGAGSVLFDADGREYIDFTSGIGVNSVGYCNSKWIEAVTKQACMLAHISNLYYTLPGTELAEKLCTLSGMDKAFFANSGAEANEGLIKLARKYSFDKYGAGRHKILTLVNSFHGRTITTLAATGQDKFHNFFFPFTEGFAHIPAGDIDALKAADDGTVCALMLEGIQGEGGVMPLDPEYLRKAEEICREKDWLFLMDEVQTGIGRTGTLFSYQAGGVHPDAVSFAKGIAGGLPLGGILASEKVSKVLGAGTHATTFGANPICCAAALSVLEILTDDGVMAEVAAKGDYIRNKIAAMKLSCVHEVRGAGLMIGVAVKDIAPGDAVKQMIGEGLLALTAGTDVIRFLPPLTISYLEIDRGLGVFEKTLSRL